MSKVEVSDSVVSLKRLRCAKCGGSYMRRLPRHGFLQEKVYALFGYFPWECAHCRRMSMLRVRSKRSDEDEGGVSLAR